MSQLLQDARYALRTLLRAPGFTLVAVLTLALGIGANTAIFSVINAVMLRPPPYPEPERLMMPFVLVRDSAGTVNDTLPWSYPKYRILREQQRVYSQVGAFSAENVNLTGVDDPERLQAEVVTASYFPVLGVEAVRGRVFLPEEDAIPGTHPVALIGYGLWQRRFGGDHSVVGSHIRLDETTLTVVGVLPEGFTGLSGNAEVWVPTMMAPTLSYPELLDEQGNHWLSAIARLQPGLTLAQARDDAARVGAIVSESFPMELQPSRHGTAGVMSLKAVRVDPTVRRSALVLFGTVAMVLLIACVNVANLALARASSRTREVAVRIALGANRSRLVRQMLTESVLLALMGGVLGALLASWGVDALVALAPAVESSAGVSRAVGPEAIRIDLAVLAFTGALAVGTAFLFGVVPALRASRPRLTAALKEGGSVTTQGLVSRQRLTPRGALVAAQIALAVVLLVGAGLMLRSFARMRGTDLGMNAERLLTVRLQLPGGAYDRTKASAFFDQLLQRVSALPGVTGSTIDICTPLSNGCSESVVTQAGSRTIALDAGPTIGLHHVAPDHFRALGIPLVAGRSFTPADRAGAPLTVVLNRAGADRLFPGRNPIGERIAIAMWLFPTGTTAEVVGVVGDVKYGGVDEAPRPDAYFAQGYGARSTAYLMVRTGGDPLALVPAVRQAVVALDRDVPIFDVSLMTERVASAMSTTRFSAILLATFAAIALVLAAVGVYGVMAYAVRHRTHEIGLRMALGAGRGDVARMMIGQGVLLTVVGVLVGLAAALSLTRVLSTLLYGVSATDGATFAAVALVLAVVAMVATYVPVRRATHVDPVVALKHD